MKHERDLKKYSSKYNGVPLKNKEIEAMQKKIMKNFKCMMRCNMSLHIRTG